MSRAESTDVPTIDLADKVETPVVTPSETQTAAMKAAEAKAAAMKEAEVKQAEIAEASRVEALIEKKRESLISPALTPPRSSLSSHKKGAMRLP